MLHISICDDERIARRKDAANCGKCVGAGAFTGKT